ncbi:MAG TPA: MFS transporter [Acidimicrobiales bacterium]|jgi:EmrB/QacA subfamily drug resistance transporter|nr:MFS transporter [Acidimicrobiales bacterium]
MAGPGEHVDELSIDAPGADEIQVVPWPLLLRQRVHGRVAGSPRYPWVVLAAALFGLFSVGFTITILSVSVPRIAEELHSDASTVTWVVTGPLLAFAVVGPAAGKLGDLYGHRRVYGMSMLCVSLFAALTAAAWSAGALIAFRTLGAATGAAVGPASIAVINRLFPPERRVQAMGYWSMVGAGGPVIGVVAGGPIVETFGWRWIFVAQVPLTLTGLLLAMLVLPETDRRDRVPFDYVGAIALALGATSLLFAINRGPSFGWSDPMIVTGFVLAPVAVAAFFVVERRIANPLLPLAYVRHRNFSFAIITQTFTNFAYMGGFVITPLFLESEFGYPETRVGGLMIARPLAFAITGPLAGYIAVRVGERTSAVVGAAFIAVSMLALSTIEPGSTDLVIIGALALSGIGIGASAPALAASIANSVAEEDLGVAGAFQQMMTQLGVVIGIQVMQTVSVVRASAAGSVGAYSEAYLVGGAVAALGIVTSMFVRSSPRRAEGAPQGALERDPEPVVAR